MKTKTKLILIIAITIIFTLIAIVFTQTLCKSITGTCLIYGLAILIIIGLSIAIKAMGKPIPQKEKL